MPPRKRLFFKVDVNVANHPKFVGLSDPAFRLIVETWGHCATYLTDGAVTGAAMRRLARTPDALQELVDEGLIEPDGQDWLVHDWLDIQPSKAEVEAALSARREAGRRGGVASVEARRGTKLKQVLEHPVEQVLEQPSSGPSSKVQPDRDRDTRTTTTAVGRYHTVRALPSKITDDMLSWAAENTPGVDVEAETAKFRDHAVANGRTAQDWMAAWRLWMRNAKDRSALVPVPRRPYLAAVPTTQQRVEDGLALAARLAEEEAQ